MPESKSSGQLLYEAWCEQFHVTPLASLNWASLPAHSKTRWYMTAREFLKARNLQNATAEKEGKDNE